MKKLILFVVLTTSILLLTSNSVMAETIDEEEISINGLNEPCVVGPDGECIFNPEPKTFEIVMNGYNVSSKSTTLVINQEADFYFSPVYPGEYEISISYTSVSNSPDDIYIYGCLFDANNINDRIGTLNSSYSIAREKEAFKYYVVKEEDEFNHDPSEPYKMRLLENVNYLFNVKNTDQNYTLNITVNIVYKGDLDTKDDPTPISPGIKNSEFQVIGDVDYYSFSFTGGGGAFNINISGLEASIKNIRIYNSYSEEETSYSCDSKILNCISDQNYYFNFESLMYYLAIDFTVYLELHHKAEIGSYSLNLDYYNDNITMTNLHDFSSDDTVNTSIDFYGDLDWYARETSYRLGMIEFSSGINPNFSIIQEGEYYSQFPIYDTKNLLGEYTYVVPIIKSTLFLVEHNETLGNYQIDYTEKIAANYNIETITINYTSNFIYAATDIYFFNHEKAKEFATLLQTETDLAHLSTALVFLLGLLDPSHITGAAGVMITWDNTEKQGIINDINNSSGPLRITIISLAGLYCDSLVSPFNPPYVNVFTADTFDFEISNMTVS